MKKFSSLDPSKRSAIVLTLLFGSLLLGGACFNKEESSTSTGPSDPPPTLKVDGYVSYDGLGNVQVVGEVQGAIGQVTSTIAWGTIPCPGCPGKGGGYQFDFKGIYDCSAAGTTLTRVIVSVVDKGRSEGTAATWTSEDFSPCYGTAQKQHLPLIKVLEQH